MQLKAVKKVVPTYTATIYCGSRVSYSSDFMAEFEFAQFVKDYVNDIGLGITVTKTEFFYTNGWEPGFIIGLINYPRFPSTPEKIRKIALELAEILLVKMNQNRVTVVFPDETVMLQDDEVDE